MTEEDLKIKLGSPEMVFWDKTIRETEFNIESSKNDIKLFKVVLKGAKREYAKAERKFNNARDISDIRE